MSLIRGTLLVLMFSLDSFWYVLHFIVCLVASIFFNKQHSDNVKEIKKYNYNDNISIFLPYYFYNTCKNAGIDF